MSSRLAVSDVLITGIGVISAAGVGTRSLAAAIRAGAAGADGPALVRAFDPDEFIEPNRSRRMDPLSKLAVSAAWLAARDAGFEAPIAGAPDARLAVVFGTSFGCQLTELRYAQKLVAQGARFTNPIDFPDSIDGAPAAHVALELGVGGPSSTHADGVLAGEHALLHGVLELASGRADRVLVGAGDLLTPTFEAAREILGCATAGARPGEGVAFLALERGAGARGRGARAHGRILALSRALEPGCRPHRLPRSPAALSSALRDVLVSAGVGAGEVDLTSSATHHSPGAERLERAALADVFSGSAHPPQLALDAITGQIAAGGLVHLAAGCVHLEELATYAGGPRERVLLHHATSPGGESSAVLVGVFRPVRAA